MEKMRVIGSDGPFLYPVMEVQLPLEVLTMTQTLELNLITAVIYVFISLKRVNGSN